MHDVIKPHRPGWGRPLSQVEIAGMFGVTQGAVSGLERMALRKLQRYAKHDPGLMQLARDFGLLDEASSPVT